MYRVIVQDQAQATVSVLPPDAAPGYFGVLGLLSANPAAGRLLGGKSPNRNIRVLPFGTAGMVTYMVLERDREVQVIEVTWLG